MIDENKVEGLKSFLLEDASSSENTFDMIGGCIYKKDGKLEVLLDKVTLNEVSGIEEDILAGRGRDFDSKFYRVIINCTKALSNKEGDVVVENKADISRLYKNLTVSDKVYLLFLLRIISVENGNIFRFKTSCPFCVPKRTLMRAVDLNKLEIKKMKEPKKRIYDYTTKNGNVFRCKVMDSSSNVSKSSGNDNATKIISSRVLEINGKPVKFSELKKLKLRERNELRKAFDEKEGGVDTTVTIECDECGGEFDTEIDITQGNFFSQ